MACEAFDAVGHHAQKRCSHGCSKAVVANWATSVSQGLLVQMEAVSRQVGQPEADEKIFVFVSERFWFGLGSLGSLGRLGSLGMCFLICLSLLVTARPFWVHSIQRTKATSATFPQMFLWFLWRAVHRRWLRFHFGVIELLSVFLYNFFRPFGFSECLYMFVPALLASRPGIGTSIMGQQAYCGCYLAGSCMIMIS